MDPSPIYLIGFMATGKSTVGALVAEQTGRRFLDLDAEIERIAEKPVARIFRDEGEGAFRKLEAKALADAAGEKDLVVACGGGTPCFGENLARMRRTGVVVALRASLQDILARAVTGGASLETRPLLSPAEGRMRSEIESAAEKLYAEREAIYQHADVMIDTSGRDAKDVAGEVTTRATMRLGDVAVHLGERSYPIHLAPLARAGALAAEMLKKPTAVAIVTDENVAAAGHSGAVRAAIEQAGLKAIEVVVPPGERSKSLDQVGRVSAACVAGGLDRRSALLAVGGGVVGDLTGFAAAILFRGVRYGQVPTSLLAMVDSAIGGKTGVDLDGGKNLLGAFWQPRFVLADPAALATLPARERRGALGEVLKYGLLGDSELFASLERDGEPTHATDLVLRCARQKARLVERDENETTGERALLNLGHTLGHAIEAASAFALLHGECVALGLVAAAKVSAGLGLCDDTLPGRVEAAVRRMGLDADLSPWLRDEVLAYIGVDKKRAGAKVRFVALEGVGKPRLVDLAPEEIGQILRRNA